jgi:hypothetical protein
MAQRHASTASPRLIVPVPITLLQQMVLKRGRNAGSAAVAALNFRELRNLGEFGRPLFHQARGHRPDRRIPDPADGSAS